MITPAHGMIVATMLALLALASNDTVGALLSGLALGTNLMAALAAADAEP